MPSSFDCAELSRLVSTLVMRTIAAEIGRPDGSAMRPETVAESDWASAGRASSPRARAAMIPTTTTPKHDAGTGAQRRQVRSESGIRVTRLLPVYSQHRG